jgi:hypothetical protein
MGLYYQVAVLLSAIASKQLPLQHVARRSYNALRLAF